MPLLSSVLLACWEVLLESAPWMLLGFLVAGLLKAFIPGDVVHRHLGGRGFSGVFKAALFGVPLPLCSCGVVPAAAGLRRQGASRGATASFLVSTPETGVDSMAITYALLDPVMTVLRPLAAFFTALLAGVAVNGVERRLGDDDEGSREPNHQDEPGLDEPGLDAGCGCSAPASALSVNIQPLGTLPLPPLQSDAHGDAPPPSHASEAAPPSPRSSSILARARSGIAYAFGDLLGDIGGWFLAGVAVAGLITALVPAGFIEAHLGRGWVPMLVMLAVAVPMYVCATASTPIAAALALKGLSPGAALVFLLAGPATNAASLTVVARIIGKRATVVYLAAIVVASLGLGAATNLLYDGLGLSVTDWAHAELGEQTGPVHFASAVVLLALLARGFWGRYVGPRLRPANHDNGESPCGCSTCSR
ncbi:MAG: SO_0444 family Cu/Zn efflux transporter [Desulfovibrionaceae bacterium]